MFGFPILHHANRPRCCDPIGNHTNIRHENLLAYSQELREHYDLYQLLLFHFQEKQADHLFELIEETISCINPIFQTVFKTFLKDKGKIINALEPPYSNAKLEATNNLIKIIKRNAFGFRNFKTSKLESSLQGENQFGSLQSMTFR